MKLINLSRGLCAKVDDEDYDSLSCFKWHARPDKINGRIYASSNIKGKFVNMHSFLIGNKVGFIIDHIDRDGLNNQRANIRHITKCQNGINAKGRINNKVGCVGVYLNKSSRNGKTYEGYVSTICVNGKKLYLGWFKKLDLAIKARKDAEKKYFPEIIVHPQDNKKYQISEKDNPILKRFYGGRSGIRGIFLNDCGNWFGRFKKNGKYYYTSTSKDISKVNEEYKILYKEHFGFDSPYHK